MESKRVFFVAHFFGAWKVEIHPIEDKKHRVLQNDVVTDMRLCWILSNPQVMIHYITEVYPKVIYSTTILDEPHLSKFQKVYKYKVGPYYLQDVARGVVTVVTPINVPYKRESHCMGKAAQETHCIYSCAV